MIGNDNERTFAHFPSLFTSSMLLSRVWINSFRYVFCSNFFKDILIIIMGKFSVKESLDS